MSYAEWMQEQAEAAKKQSEKTAAEIYDEQTQYGTKVHTTVGVDAEGKPVSEIDPETGKYIDVTGAQGLATQQVDVDKPTDYYTTEEEYGKTRQEEIAKAIQDAQKQYESEPYKPYMPASYSEYLEEIQANIEEGSPKYLEIEQQKNWYKQQEAYLDQINQYMTGQQTAAQQQLAESQARNVAMAKSMALGQRGIDLGTSLRLANQQIAQSQMQNQQQRELLRAQERMALGQQYAQGAYGLGQLGAQQNTLLAQQQAMQDQWNMAQLGLMGGVLDTQTAQQQAIQQQEFERWRSGLAEATTKYGIDKGVGVNYAPQSQAVNIGAALGGLLGTGVGAWVGGPVGAAVGGGVGTAAGGAFGKLWD